MIFSKLFSILSGKKYRKNPNTSNLSRERYVALNVGAINAEQTMYFCDSLETGASLKDTSQNLENYYCIIDGDSAINVLEWLRNGGHRIYFEAINEFVSERSSSIDDSLLLDEEKSKTYNFIKNINATINDLIEAGHLDRKENLMNYSILAWDMGRLVQIARCSYELGYISEEETWLYIEEAHSRLKEVYHDWKDVADGYIIGRCMWSGPSVTIKGFMGIISDLLKDDESPWVKCPLR